MGWGIGGLADDPFQYADDVNRSLGNPVPARTRALRGRDVLDLCAVLGLAHQDEVIDEVTEEAAEATSYAFPDSLLNPSAESAMEGPQEDLHCHGLAR